MTDSTTNPAAAALPPNVKITFRDDVTQPELRQAAERSVATLVARSTEVVARARAAEAEWAKLTDALSAPFVKLIKGDPAAARALKDLRSRELVDLDSTDVLGPDVIEPLATGGWSGDEVSVAGAVLPLPSTPPPTVLLPEATVPPYHFAWSWHDEAGSPPFDRSLNLASGRVGLVARSGAIAGGASGFVNAHAGFGLSLRTDHVATVKARSRSEMRYHYYVESLSLGGSATSEGGMEFTALENGQLVASTPVNKLWRKRVSGVESAAFGEGPIIVGEQSTLAFTMHPGRAYTFNVGIWVFSDRSPGAGIAAAQSLMEGNVLRMTIFRQLV